MYASMILCPKSFFAFSSYWASLSDASIKKTVRASDKDAQYDEKAKKLLGHKIILAYILVNTIEEFREMNPKEVVNYIEGEPYISVIPVDSIFLLYNIFLIYARGILICETVKIDELREINKAYLWLSSRRVKCSLIRSHPTLAPRPQICFIYLPEFCSLPISALYLF